MLPYNHNQLTTQDIAAMLGLSHSHVRDKIVKDPDFPDPVIALSRKTKRWRRDAVWDFVKRKSAANLNRRR